MAEWASLYPTAVRFQFFATQPAAERRRKRRQGRPETFDFLGFTHCCGTDQQGKFQVVRVTTKKRMRARLIAIREKLYQRRHEPVPVVGAWLQRVLNGYLAYHAVPTNLLRLIGFRTEVCRGWRHALMRRSQRHRLTWDRFNRLVRKYVPPCRVLHPFRRNASLRHDLKKERMR
jgi:RNA-directed DNA polymerase